MLNNEIGEDKLVASLSKEGICVECDIVSVDPYTENVWIGLYKCDEQDNKNYLDYKYLLARKVEIVFRVPKENGDYEIRLFANKSYEMIKKSEKITVNHA